MNPPHDELTRDTPTNKKSIVPPLKIELPKDAKWDNKTLSANETTRDVMMSPPSSHEESYEYFPQTITPVDTDEKKKKEEELEKTYELMYGGEDPARFPDGGTAAWIVLLGSFVGLISTFGIPNSIGAVESYISSNQLADLSTSTVSWIFSLNLTVLYMTAVIFGQVFDAVGARIPIAVGTGIIFLGLMTTAEATKMWHFVLTYLIVTATGILIAMCPMIAALSHWFLRRRALALSSATVGGLVGGSCFSIMLQKLFDKMGFQWAMRIYAFVNLAFCIVSLVFVRERREMMALAESDPEAPKVSLGRRLWNFTRNLLDIKLFTDKRFLLTATAISISETLTLLTFTYLASYALSYNMSNLDSYLMLTIVNVCGIPSRFLTGYLADIFGRFNVMIVTLCFSCVFVFALWFPSKESTGVLFAFATLFGLSASAVMSLIPACCGQICAAKDFGKVYGTTYFTMGFFTLVLMYCCSLIIGDRSQANMSHYVLFEGALAATSIVLWVLAKGVCTKWNMKQKF